VNPANQQVTHLIVQPQGKLQCLVPVDQVTEASPTSVHLRCTQDELARMEHFIEYEYVMTAPDALVWVPEPQMVPMFHRRIPRGEFAIERGSNVEAIDGHVGKVDELLVDSRDDPIMHLVLRKGHLWGQKDVMIPASQIDHIANDTVFLKLDKRAVESLLAVPVRK
jgi:sporulation protein YlmC with PRC-barrel domain